jgi:RNA polymerase sigma-70 factor, ECF subfamily
MLTLRCEEESLKIYCNLCGFPVIHSMGMNLATAIALPPGVMFHETVEPSPDGATLPPDTAQENVVEDPDALLMLRVGTGDEQALAQLIERWKNPMINFFYRSLGSYESAEDLAQVVFIKIFRAAPKYRATAKFSTFLFYIARRLLINEYRRSQRKPLESVDPAELHAVDPARSDREVAEIEEVFAKALRSLPEKQATAILLFKQQGLSYEEIAQTMDASVGAVKTWIFRARETLKEEMKENLTTIRQL